MEEKFSVDKEDVGKRFDMAILAHFPDLTRSRIKLVIENGQATLDGKVVKSGEKIIMVKNNHNNLS